MSTECIEHTITAQESSLAMYCTRYTVIPLLSELSNRYKLQTYVARDLCLETTLNSNVAFVPIIVFQACM